MALPLFGSVSSQVSSTFCCCKAVVWKILGWYLEGSGVAVQESVAGVENVMSSGMYRRSNLVADQDFPDHSFAAAEGGAHLG